MARVPVHGFDEEIAPASGADAKVVPELELWLEDSGDSVSQRDQDQAAEQARGALAEVSGATAIDPHALGARDPLLLVRERAVTRTSGHKTDQVVATVGIVVGIVAVVAVLVAVASGHGGGGGGGAGHLGALHGVAAGGVHAMPVHAIPISGTHVPMYPHHWVQSGSVAIPAPGRRGHGWRRAYCCDLIDPGIELAFETGQADELASEEEAREAAIDEAEMAAGDPAPPAEIVPPAIPLAFDLDDRGFFSGDQTQLELDLYDRADGRLLWRGAAQKDIDPRDAGDLGELFDLALGGQPWAAAR